MRQLFSKRNHQKEIPSGLKKKRAFCFFVFLNFRLSLLKVEIGDKILMQTLLQIVKLFQMIFKLFQIVSNDFRLFSLHEKFFIFSNASLFKLPDGRIGQLVLQVRVNPLCICKVQGEKLLQDQSVVIDTNYANDELEWVIKPEEEKVKTLGLQQSIVISGLMARVCDKQPLELDDSKWWSSCVDKGVNMRC